MEGQGGPPFFFWWESYFLCYLGAHAKIWNLMISLSGIYLKIAHFPVKIGLIGGVGGVPEICFSLESSSFCYLGAHAKIQNPSFLLSGRKVRESEERREITASTIVTTSAQRRSDQLLFIYCEAQSQLQGKLSLKIELALFFFNPATQPTRKV